MTCGCICVPRYRLGFKDLKQKGPHLAETTCLWCLSRIAPGHVGASCGYPLGSY